MKYWKIKRFALIGIIIFVYVFGLSSTLLFLYSRHGDGETDKLKNLRAKAQVVYVKRILFEFKMDNGFYPTTEQGLDALVRKPTVEPIPKKYKVGGYLAKIPKDPWEKPFVYISPGSKGEFEIFSSIDPRG